MADRNIDLSTIPVQNVGASCIMWVSKFSRVIYAKHKVIIRLHDPNVLNTVCAYANLIKDDELQLIYKNIEIQINKYLKSKYPHTKGNIDFRLNKKVALENKNHFRVSR